MLRFRCFRGWVALFAGVVFSYSPHVHANIFSVNPIHIYLTSKSTSSLLTVHNDSSEVLRFQVTVSAWDESPKGESILTPTQDIIFFPALMTVGPGQERKIRVGTVNPTPAQEKTYRIFVQELPPEQKPNQSKQNVYMRVLTRMAIPIFQEPESMQSTVALEDLSIANGKFLFNLKNPGNAHFIPQKIHVKAISAKGAAVIDKDLPAWYVLAGHLRAYDIDVPKAVCASIQSFKIRVELEGKTVEKTYETKGGACGPPKSVPSSSPSP